MVIHEEGTSIIIVKGGDFYEDDTYFVCLGPEKTVEEAKETSWLADRGEVIGVITADNIPPQFAEGWKILANLVGYHQMCDDNSPQAGETLCNCLQAMLLEVFLKGKQSK